MQSRGRCSQTAVPIERQTELRREGEDKSQGRNDHETQRDLTIADGGGRRHDGGRAGASAQDRKFPFRLNWTLYGEHAPFFVALDKGFYKEAGLDVEILEGSGSTTVAQLIANATNPVSYVDAATMMRGINAGMPIKAVGVTLQQSPMSFIYRADNPRPTKISEIKGSRIAITAGDASLAIFTAFMGKLDMKVSDVKLITVANPAAKEQAVLDEQADALLGYFMDQGPRMQLQTGVKMGWTRLYDMAGISTLSAAPSSSTTIGSRTPRTRIGSALPARLAARLGLHRQHPRRGGRNLHQACARPSTRRSRCSRSTARMTIIHTKHTEGQAAVLVGEGRLAGKPGSAGEIRQACRRRPTGQVLHQRISVAAALHDGEEVASHRASPRQSRGGAPRSKSEGRCSNERTLSSA